jgi:threonine/homoserine/homoserine lactone efflux protein
MAQFSESAVRRRRLGGGGIYLIALGIAFGLASFRYDGPAFLLFVGNATRDTVLGLLVVFCAYRFSVVRAGLVSAILGFVLLVLVATTAVFTDHFGIWTALRLLGGLLLVFLGISANRSDRRNEKQCDLAE